MADRYRSKSKPFLRAYILYKASRLASGIRACYRYDSRVRRIVDNLPDGFDICVGILGHNHMVVITKTGEELHCKLVDGYATGDIYIYFKNMEGATMVLRNRISYLQAYTQSRIVLQGDIQRAMDFVSMLLIAQTYMASPLQRKYYLGQLAEYEVSPAKIKARAFFRGWL